MNRERNFKLAMLAVIAGWLFFLTACTTTEGGSGKSVKAREEPVEIHKGMLAEDLIAQLGEPDEIRETTPPAEGTEIWVYRKVDENVALVLSGTTETPGMDIGGVPMTITDNVYTPATSRYVEETLFLMVDGVMTAWKVRRSEQSHLN